MSVYIAPLQRVFRDAVRIRKIRKSYFVRPGDPGVLEVAKICRPRLQHVRVSEVDVISSINLCAGCVARRTCIPFTISSNTAATSELKQAVKVIWQRPHRLRTWTVHSYSPRGANVHPVYRKPKKWLPWQRPLGAGYQPYLHSVGRPLKLPP